MEELGWLGTPWVLALSRGVRRNYPAFADFLLLPQFQLVLGVPSPERVRFRQPASKPDMANAQE